jgi:chemotaxis signal transduction protein
MSLLDDLIPHMRRVQVADRDLHDLSLLWQMIEASSAISAPLDAESILPTLSDTRARFTDLQQRLVLQLATESLAELGDELCSTARCTIDILVRNLFERTADVGFLATDDVLCAFCAADAAAREAGSADLVRRLSEYRAKYTVYDDVIVLDAEGRVLVRLDGPAGTTSSDPLVREAAGRTGPVERFGASDLAADARQALLYGHRIDDAQGRCIGVLVLRFRLFDELARIFASVSVGSGALALVLLDDQGRVVVSSSESHVPLGATLETGADGAVGLTYFGGREYLSVTCVTRGYQGYGGPGWRAHAMVSLQTAFRNQHDPVSTDEAVALDNEELQRIQGEVEAINRNLRRVVWNGRLMAGNRPGAQAHLKAVLQQVNLAGTRTRDRVDAAIGDLYRCSLGRAAHQSRELARLAADIMDRNLYERANDCRWWALSPVLRRELAAPVSAVGSAAMSRVLGTINGLYTVYTRLAVFDLGGQVRGLSNDTEASLLGTPVPPAWLQAVRGLTDAQRYAVSDFGATALSDGVPTSVYLAAVRSPQGGDVVGGIAIVFNARREFHAMLADVLGQQRGLAAFVDGEGRVLASTDEHQAIGQPLRLDTSRSVVAHDGEHFAVAHAPASGYREFKREDGHADGVHAVVALRLGTVERRSSSTADLPLQAHPSRDRSQTQEYAMFSVGPGRYAVPVAAVQEARPTQGLIRAPGQGPCIAGLLEVPAPGGSRMVPVLCARQLFGVAHPARAGDGVVLVMAAGFGLRVDDVLCVAEVGAEHRQAAPAGLAAHLPMLSALLRLASPGAADVLVQLIDPAGVARQGGLALAAPAAATL